MNKSFKKTEINIRFPGWKTKALTFSYDDGVYADEHLIDIFNKYGLKGTFNINSGNIGANVPRKYGHARLDENAVSRLYTKGGHEVAMHTLTHPFLSKLNSAGVTYELLQDKINLEKITHHIIRGFAYPYGDYNDTAVEILKNLGIVYARTAKSTGGFEIPVDFLRYNPTCHHFDSKLMNYCEKFVVSSEESFEGKEPYLFFVWGHAYELEDSRKWDVIENMAKYVCGKGDVWYAANIEIFEYCQCFNSLVFNSERTMLFNPSYQPVYFERMGKKYKVNPGESINMPV